MKISSFIIGLCLAMSAFGKSVEVDIVGMSCGMCIEAITRELKNTGKVENVSVLLDERKAKFTEVKDKKISDNEIKSAIKKAGYEAVKVRRVQ